MLTYRHLSRMFTQTITQTFKFRFISASNKCSTAKLVINFCNKVYKHKWSKQILDCSKLC